MGVIRKKSATRVGEGGVKYVCDVCSADITSTVRTRCAHNACNDYDLCVQCFANGDYSSNHQPPTHPYHVIEQNSVPIYDRNWGADEELLLLEGAENYGLGSWADIAEHIGGFWSKDEVREHYKKVYLDSPNFPLPLRASPHDMELLNEIPREEFQARKKRRIEERKERSNLIAPAQPKTKPNTSQPSCHEIAGYMPGRMEFETEHFNEAEEAVQHMQFEPGDGINPRTGELDPEMDLKLTVMDIYNSRLTQRADRKKVIFEHHLLEYKKNFALDKKRTKDEVDLLKKTKPFARMMNHKDYEDFCSGLIEELNLRQAVAQLQDWRAMKIGDLRTGEKYEQEKIQRAQKAVPLGSMDRDPYSKAPQRNKAPPISETPSGAALLVAPDLPTHLTPLTATSFPARPPNNDKILTNGHANVTLTPRNQVAKDKHPIVIQPISSLSPLTLSSKENVSDIHLLTAEEIELCEKVRLHPKPYLVIKDAMLRECVKGNGTLKKKQVRELANIDPQKSGRLFEFFVGAGWLGKA